MSPCLPSLRASGPTILPSLLLCDFGRLADEVERLEEAGVAALHLDVMDGVFVPNFTYGMTIVKAFRSLTELPLDVHLMMVHPEKYLEAFRDAGADVLTIHAEAVEDPVPVLKQIRALGCEAGIAINPATPVAAIANALPHADLALIMSVKAGFGGQKFDPSVLNKLAEIRQLPGGEEIALEIDGGINAETVGEAVGSGAELLVAGSAIFGKPDYRAALELMMQQIEIAG